MSGKHIIKFGQVFLPIDADTYGQCLANPNLKVKIAVGMLESYLEKNPEEIKLMHDPEASPLTKSLLDNAPTEAALDFKDKVNTLVSTVLDKESVEAEYLVARFLRANPDIEFKDIAIERKLGVDGALSLSITRKRERE